VEQIPALVFVAYVEQGISEAYVSPQIELALGFSQEEWLRWYRQIHPEDTHRWSMDAPSFPNKPASTLLPFSVSTTRDCR
jgi:hypothetical protein